MDFEFEILEIKSAMADECNNYRAKLGMIENVEPSDIEFDDSRAWSLAIKGDKLDLGCRKFGAYRNYLGGGVRGSIEHNGEDKTQSTELGLKFVEALKRVEKLYNQETEGDEVWNQASGVLL